MRLSYETLRLLAVECNDVYFVNLALLAAEGKYIGFKKGLVGFFWK